MSIGTIDTKSQIADSPSTSRAGILVVDEDPAFQLGLKTFLKEYVGFDRVFTARNGKEALELIEKEESIEVVTLDYEMPGMNGIQMLRNLTDTDHRPLSVMMVTGYPSDELEDEFHSFQSPTLLTTHFVAKPVEFEKLEPLVLSAHDELLAAKNKPAEAPDSDVVMEAESPLTSPLAPADPEDLEHTVAEMEAKLSAQSIQLNELEKKVESQSGRWRSDLFLVVMLVIAAWIAAEFGLFDSLKPTWENLKADIRSSFAAEKAENDATETASEETAPEAAIPEPAPAPQADPMPERPEPAAPAEPDPQPETERNRVPLPDSVDEPL